MTAVNDSSDELLRRIQRVDEAAFLTLYRQLQAPIYRFGLHMTGSPAAAEDVTQEVFLALLSGNCAFDPERGTLNGYLFGVARKLVLRYLERNRSAGEQDLDNADWSYSEAPAHPDVMLDLLRRESIEGLRRAVLSLPKRYREVVVLCDLEEMDYTEAADVLGCPIGTIRSRLHRARGLLLEKLQQAADRTAAIPGLKPVRSLI